jgi:hypothetical protein
MSGFSQIEMSGSASAPGHVAGLPDNEQARAGSSAADAADTRAAWDAAQVAEQLGVTVRHVEWLFRAYKDGGAAALVSKKRGRPSARRLSEATRAEVLRVVRERYADFGPTLAHEKLTELHAATVSVETLRQWMIAAGIWLPRAQRRKAPHPPRYRRPCFGELVRSMAATTSGSRSATPDASCWCTSTTRRVGSWNFGSSSRSRGSTTLPRSREGSRSCSRFPRVRTWCQHGGRSPR